jgi:hypothetical protein
MCLMTSRLNHKDVVGVCSGVQTSQDGGCRRLRAATAGGHSGNPVQVCQGRMRAGDQVARWMISLTVADYGRVKTGGAGSTTS